MQQVDDFVAECASLDEVLSKLSPTDFGWTTQFKAWTVNDVLQHLHIFNLMADCSLSEPDRFEAEWRAFDDAMNAGGTMRAITNRMLGGLSGPDLLTAWRGQVGDMAPRFAAANPKARVKWAGPEMSVRSSITARQMETWAHGQEIWDLVGLVRVDTDRIRNIAHLGLQTYGWTFVNYGEAAPEPMPFVRLHAPSGTVWEWGEPSPSERVEGSATEFCQVVTQTRNIADTGLEVVGSNATRWMQIAQCFAGPPETPPAPGTRGID